MKNRNDLFAVVVSLVFLLILSSLSLLATSSNSNEVKGTIIFNFAGEKGNSPKAYIFGGKTIDKVISNLGLKVEEIIGGSKERKVFLEKLKKKYKRGTSNRWISKEGDKLEVFTFFKKSRVKTDMKKESLEQKISFAEKSHKTQIAQDLSVLVKTVVAIATKGDPPDIEIFRTTYHLTKKQAIVTVTASFNGTKTSKVEVVTGPSQHWFLTTDLPVAKLSKVKFVQGKDKGTIEPRETPKDFYLGLNCMIGDVLKERQNIFKNFFIKGMLKLSKRPLDGYGVGIGYRFPKVRPLGLDISSFSVFAAIMWTKEEDVANTEKLMKRQILFGTSYNLDKAKGWGK